jgi:hypothetical protein
MQPCGVCLPLLRSQPLCQQQEQHEFFHVRYSRLALDLVFDPQEILAQEALLPSLMDVVSRLLKPGDFTQNPEKGLSAHILINE